MLASLLLLRLSSLGFWVVIPGDCRSSLVRLLPHNHLQVRTPPTPRVLYEPMTLVYARKTNQVPQTYLQNILVNLMSLVKYEELRAALRDSTINRLIQRPPLFLSPSKLVQTLLLITSVTDKLRKLKNVVKGRKSNGTYLHDEKMEGRNGKFSSFLLDVPLNSSGKLKGAKVGKPLNLFSTLDSAQFAALVRNSTHENDDPGGEENETGKSGEGNSLNLAMKNSSLSTARLEGLNKSPSKSSGSHCEMTPCSNQRKSFRFPEKGEEEQPTSEFQIFHQNLKSPFHDPNLNLLVFNTPAYYNSHSQTGEFPLKYNDHPIESHSNFFYYNHQIPKPSHDPFSIPNQHYSSNVNEGFTPILSHHNSNGFGGGLAVENNISEGSKSPVSDLNLKQGSSYSTNSVDLNGYDGSGTPKFILEQPGLNHKGEYWQGAGEENHFVDHPHYLEYYTTSNVLGPDPSFSNEPDISTQITTDAGTPGVFWEYAKGTWGMMSGPQSLQIFFQFSLIVLGFLAFVGYLVSLFVSNTITLSNLVSPFRPFSSMTYNSNNVNKNKKNGTGVFGIILGRQFNTQPIFLLDDHGTLFKKLENLVSFNNLKTHR